MDLEELRNEIDAIDRELVCLFCKRMETAAKIADYKKEHNLPISHPGREQEVLETVSALSGTELGEYVQSLYAELFNLSKRYQTHHNQCP